MNRIIAPVFALALLAAGAASAAPESDHTGPQFAAPVASASSLTRAEVKAEVLQARANGTLEAISNHIGPVSEPAAAATALSRAQVRADLFQARADGSLLNGSDNAPA